MNLLYILTGDNINHHIEAQFSICSFLPQKHEINTINVVTDNPSFYNNLKEEINIITIDKATIDEWKGEYNFFWRIKIKAIAMLCALYKNEPVMYLDGDTFLYKDVELLKKILAQGSAMMHANEGPLAEKKSKRERKMWQAVKDKAYGNVTITASHHMWNAGVVATPNTKKGEECELALLITDAMCKQGVTRWLIEQFALSVSLHETYGVQTADNYIAHYWSNKNEWKTLIAEFLLTSYFKGYTNEQLITAMMSFDYNSLPVIKKQKSTKERLEKLVGKMFPPKEIMYVNDDRV